MFPFLFFLLVVRLVVGLILDLVAVVATHDDVAVPFVAVGRRLPLSRQLDLDDQRAKATLSFVEAMYCLDGAPALAAEIHGAGRIAPRRRFELPVDDPVGGFLLLHGLTDSPYSLRALGAKLHELGYHVVGLRLPGHGTVPAALKKTRWQDWAAASRLALAHLAAEVGDRPIHVAGYSTGAGLALDLAITALDNQTTRPASLILVSPAIGVSAAAALAGPTATLGRVPGFGRLAWAETTPEFDPYKYNSFPVNAGAQAAVGLALDARAHLERQRADRDGVADRETEPVGEHRVERRAEDAHLTWSNGFARAYPGSIQAVEAAAQSLVTLLEHATEPEQATIRSMLDPSGEPPVTASITKRVSMAS